MKELELSKLLGRRSERREVEQLLVRALAGRSGALVVCGDAGIGKTALLEHGREAAEAAGFRVASSTGIDTESQFAFAGLHQLCSPLLDHVQALPDPQQLALGVALGIRSGPVPDRFLVGLATLNLLAEVAEHGPLLCLIDDAQWLDRASAEVLAFVARRVAAERLVMLFALRDTPNGDGHAFVGLPALRLDGLGATDARDLLMTAVGTPLDAGVIDRIVAEARGNPLALLELPLSVQPSLLAGGFELPDVTDIPRRIEDSFQRRSRELPPQTQQLLLVAAAEPTGDALLLWHAAAELKIGREAAAPAEAVGLVAIDTRIRFRHPLVRSAIYQSASPADRRLAHWALAEATDPVADPDRRAWHRAQAVSGTDEEAAAAVERSAGRARARGGVAAAAAFLQQAADLSPQPAARARRSLEAAHAKHDAGLSKAAQDLLAIAEVGALDDVQHARLKLLRGRTEFHLTQSNEVPGLLLDAAMELAAVDPALSREAFLHALDAAVIVGDVDSGRGVLEVAAAAREAPRPPEFSRPADSLLDGLVVTFTQGYVAGVPELHQALEAFRDRGFDGEALGQMGSRHWLWLASRTAAALFDDELVLALADRNVRLAREAGALITLPRALVALSASLVLAGELAYAAELAAEGAAITLATGAVPLRYAELFVAAWRGDEPETIQLHAASIENATGKGSEATLAHYALAVLHNALGDYSAAQKAATRACQSYELVNTSLALPELIEAASRTGDADQAVGALEELESRAHATGTPWALGLAAQSRALISTGSVAEANYRQAIEFLQNTRAAAHLARSHLVFGEWLRREGRRQEARDVLRIAHHTLSDMGARAFAARAANELRATGEHPRQRIRQSTEELTAQEGHVARLVATGATSREIGAQLFLSPRTIEAHLRNIFRKLGITSRRQLKELHLP